MRNDYITRNRLATCRSTSHRHLRKSRGTIELPFEFEEWVDQSTGDILEKIRGIQYNGGDLEGFDPSVITGKTGVLEQANVHRFFVSFEKQFKKLTLNEKKAFVLVDIEGLSPLIASRRLKLEPTDVRKLLESAREVINDTFRAPIPKDLAQMAQWLFHFKSVSDGYAKHGAEALRLDVVHEFIRLLSLVPIPQRHFYILNHLFSVPIGQLTEKFDLKSDVAAKLSGGMIDAVYRQWQLAYNSGLE